MIWPIDSLAITFLQIVRKTKRKKMDDSIFSFYWGQKQAPRKLEHANSILAACFCYDVFVHSHFYSKVFFKIEIIATPPVEKLKLKVDL